MCSSIAQLLDYSGKAVLVTGAGTGIGREIALEFARCGAQVIFHYSHSPIGALAAVEEVTRFGGQAVALRADFSHMDDVHRLAAEAETVFGKVDVLINNSGITLNRPFSKVTPEEFEKLYHVNVRAGFFLTQRLAQGMSSRGKGSICNLTSIHGQLGAAEHALYAGTKGAIIAWTRSLAVEVAHRGVRVNAIAPGWIDVEGHREAIPDYDPAIVKRIAAEKIPLGRHGEAIDVARLAVFLCSDAASFIIGQTIVIDGGTTSLMSLMTDFRTESSARFGEQYL